MSLRLVWTRRAKRQGDRLDPAVFKRILRGLRRYAEERRGDVRKVRDSDPPEWRLRVGDYRIRFSVRSDVLEVLHLGHRRDVYRR